MVTFPTSRGGIEGREESDSRQLPMLSAETLDTYRRMTPSQRLKLTMEMVRENTPHLPRGSPDVVARRFELIRRENDARNRNMLTAIARTK